MPVTLRREAVAEIVRRCIRGSDHRDIIVDLIDAIFVSDVITFFEQIISTKIHGGTITVDLYKKHFLDAELPTNDIIWNSGLNIKTIKNKHRSVARTIALEEASEHFEKFVQLVNALSDESVNVDLSLSLGDVTVHLSLNESLIVINALAVRRAAIRGGAWSSAGKQVEGPLMETLCHLFDVEAKYFTRALADDGSLREVDYYLLSPDGSQSKCEVKLMGGGNPESMDGVIARDSKVFVASTLSSSNTAQLDEWSVLWTELQTENGFLRFRETLRQLGIPHSALTAKSDYSQDIERAIEATFGSV